MQQLNQSTAKRIAEKLLGRQVKMKQKDGVCSIYPATTTNALIAGGLSFAQATHYYGPTWDEAIERLEAHIRFTTTGVPVEGKMIVCKNCDDPEHLTLVEEGGKKTFHCDLCKFSWEYDRTDMSVEAIEEPPQLSQTGLPEGTLLVPSGTQQQGDNMAENENQGAKISTNPQTASEKAKMHADRHPGDQPRKDADPEPMTVRKVDGEKVEPTSLDGKGEKPPVETAPERAKRLGAEGVEHPGSETSNEDEAKAQRQKEREEGTRSTEPGMPGTKFPQPPENPRIDTQNQPGI